MKVLFVVTGLPVGGAEKMLLRVCRGLSPGYTPSVVVLERLSQDGLASQFHEAGIPLRSLNMKGPASVPSGVLKLAILLRRERPDVVCTWLYHADLIGTLACRLAGHRALAWNIRNSDLEPSRTPLSRRLVARANAAMSRAPQIILCCSAAAQDIHVAFGYEASRFRLIPNGFDLSLFRPDPGARMAVRTELGVAPEAPLIGMIARFDPYKDHRSFIAAAGIVHRHHPSARFVLVGKGCEASNETLTGWIAEQGLAGTVHLLGMRTDVPRLTAAFDVATLTSWGEAFPNVVGEAMACAVPCLATDVGDAAAILGDTGLIVRPGNVDDIAEGWQRLLDLGETGRRKLGAQGRVRVQAHYELRSVLAQYEQTFDELAARRHG